MSLGIAETQHPVPRKNSSTIVHVNLFRRTHSVVPRNPRTSTSLKVDGPTSSLICTEYISHTRKFYVKWQRRKRQQPNARPITASTTSGTTCATSTPPSTTPMTMLTPRKVDRTAKLVGDNSSNAQIRTLLDEQRQMIRRKHYCGIIRQHTRTTK